MERGALSSGDAAEAAAAAAAAFRVTKHVSVNRNLFILLRGKEPTVCIVRYGAFQTMAREFNFS